MSDGLSNAIETYQLISCDLGEESSGLRLDQALSLAILDLSRGQIQDLMLQGLVSYDDKSLTKPSARVKSFGTYQIRLPSAISATPLAEDLDLDILYEDAHLIVINKPAGMAAHPAPGTPKSTLVNGLLHHCGESLSGIGGVLRPGIVHRLDKNTSGVMVAAKTQAAHQGLSAIFARHDIERLYTAITRGAPAQPQGKIQTRIGRSLQNRKKMAVLKVGGREAITHYKLIRSFQSPAMGRTSSATAPAAAPVAAQILCRLETGRTHQIRVHLASLGLPCLGDPLYGSALPALFIQTAMKQAGLTRQALHAGVLAFDHPITGKALSFETPLPEDMTRLIAQLS